MRERRQTLKLTEHAYEQDRTMPSADSSIRRAAGVAAAVAMMATLLGCGILGGGREPPPGAQVVKVIQTGDQVSLDASTARAGEIWLEFPPEGATLVTHGLEGLEPLSDEEIARLARQDTQGMTVNGFSVHDTPYGRLELKAGKYAFVVFDETLPPDVDPVGIPPLSMAILEVTP